MAATAGSRSISSDRATREAIIGLQERIDALLSLNGQALTLSCGELVSVAQYFMDLRAVTALIFASWPLARPLAATEVLARAADRDGERRQRSARDLRSRVKGARVGDFFLAPPDTALATSAILGIAERLLKAADNSEERAGLIELYQPAVAGRAPLSRRLVAELGASPPLCRTLGITPRPRKAATRSASQASVQEAG
ncbi:hypothetical protein [Streptomyces sp. P9-2]|uniref:hypothetical protein n=1 Tax=Streptomyces sp. P9-2 TaxID=3423201 RepID=UPI003F743741